MTDGNRIGLFLIDLDEVQPELRLDRLRYLAHREGEGRLLELLDEASAGTATEESTLGPRDRVRRFSLRDFLDPKLK